MTTANWESEDQLTVVLDDPERNLTIEVVFDRHHPSPHLNERRPRAVKTAYERGGTAEVIRMFHDPGYAVVIVS